VCARVTARGDGARTRGDGEGGVRERRTAREGATTTTTTAAVRAEIEGGGGERAVVEAGEGGAAATATATPAPRRENVAAVAAGWLRGVVARGRRDDGARERERERKRREREAEIEKKRARKERDRIERERVEAAKLEREAQLEAFRAAERDRRANDETASGGGARDVDRGDASQPGSPRRSFHIPNVEEIKQRVSEGAHQLGEVAHQLGDRLRDTGDKIAHNVNEQAHHVKDALRDTNNRVGKALAKKRWVRDIAARLSPNSILVVAIAIALAGLPENRDKARRKAQSVKKRIKETRRESSETAKAKKKKTASEEEEDLPEVIYNELADPDEDTPFIGRGPTPRGVYEVVEGDTLCSIAGCFNLDLMEIIDKNGDVIRNPDALAPGDRIRIY
jgi:LysM repeat protein